MSDRNAKFEAKLPQGDANGLNDPDVVRKLIEHPAELRIGIVIFDVKKIETDIDDGTQTAKARLRRVEVIMDDSKGDATALQRLLIRAYERRTGATTLDQELEEEVRMAFDNIRITDDDL